MDSDKVERFRDTV